MKEILLSDVFLCALVPPSICKFGQNGLAATALSKSHRLSGSLQITSSNYELRTAMIYRNTGRFRNTDFRENQNSRTARNKTHLTAYRVCSPLRKINTQPHFFAIFATSAAPLRTPGAPKRIRKNEMRLSVMERETSNEIAAFYRSGTSSF